jgi:hypothetical protein
MKMNNNKYNVRANNAQSYLNHIKAMKLSGRSSMAGGRRMQTRIPGIKRRR